MISGRTMQDYFRTGFIHPMATGVEGVLQKGAAEYQGTTTCQKIWICPAVTSRAVPVKPAVPDFFHLCGQDDSLYLPNHFI